MSDNKAPNSIHEIIAAMQDGNSEGLKLISALSSAIEEGLKDSKEKIPPVNVLVAGRSGTGKTTLINQIFDLDLPTGVYDPTTTAYSWHPEKSEENLLYLCNARGLELGELNVTRDLFLQEIETLQKSKDPNDHVHVIWYVLTEIPPRFEQPEQELINTFMAKGIPVIIVINRTPVSYLNDNEQTELHERIIEEAARKDSLIHGIHAITPVYEVPKQRVAPKTYVFREKFVGLDKLVALTLEAMGDGHRAARAFIAAQEVDIQAKFDQCDDIIKEYANYGAVTGGTPYVSVLLVLAAKIRMLMVMSRQVGIAIKPRSYGAITLMVISALGLSVFGRAVVFGIFRLVRAGVLVTFGHGAGVAYETHLTMAESVVSAAQARATTLLLGRGYKAYLMKLYEEHGKLPEHDELLAGFKDYWKKFRKSNPEPTDPDAAESPPSGQGPT